MGKNLDTDTVKTGNAVKSDEEWRKTLTPEVSSNPPARNRAGIQSSLCAREA